MGLRLVNKLVKVELLQFKSKVKRNFKLTMSLLGKAEHKKDFISVDCLRAIKTAIVSYLDLLT